MYTYGIKKKMLFIQIPFNKNRNEFFLHFYNLCAKKYVQNKMLYNKCAKKVFEIKRI